MEDFHLENTSVIPDEETEKKVKTKTGKAF
jgi:hypothetical protein